jgi:YggT family protein
MFGITGLLETLVILYMLCLFGRAIFSWVEPYPRNPVHRFLFDVTEPVIAPVRRLIPPVAGFDVAYLIVFLGLSFLLRMVQSIG